MVRLTRLSLCGLRSRAPALLGAEHQLDGIADQTEALPDLFLQVAAVREVQEARVVDEEDDRGRFVCSMCALRAPRRLSRVREFEAAPLVARRRVLEKRLTEHLVELVRPHLDASLTDHPEGGRPSR